MDQQKKYQKEKAEGERKFKEIVQKQIDAEEAERIRKEEETSSESEPEDNATVKKPHYDIIYSYPVDYGVTLKFVLFNFIVILGG